MTLPVPTAAAVRQGVRTPGPLRVSHPVMLGFTVDPSRDLSAPSVLLEPIVGVSPVVNPVLDELARASGLEKISARSYKGDPRRLATEALKRFFFAIPGRSFLPVSALKESSFASFSRTRAAKELKTLFLSRPELTSLAEVDFSKGHAPGVFVLVRLTSNLQVDFITEGFAPSLGELDLFSRRLSRALFLTPPQALVMARTALDSKIPVVDASRSPRLRSLESLVASSLVVSARPGYPCDVDVVAGEDVEVPSSRLMPVPALGLVSRWHQEIPVAVDPVVLELADMTLSGPTGRAGLFPYQDEFVSTYLASTGGLVCAMSPGMGKTVAAAVSLKEAAFPGSTSLVVASKGLHEQWFSELSHWASGLEVLKMDSSESLCEALGVESSASRVFIISPELVSNIDFDSCAFSFQELVVDEARSVSAGSKLNRALTALRSRASRAMVLTGTPAERDLSEVAQLASLARSDTRLLCDVTKGSYDPARLGPIFFDRSTSSSDAPIPRVDVSFDDLIFSPPERVLYEEFLQELSLRRDALISARQRKDGRSANSARISLVSTLNLMRACLSDPSSLLQSSSPFASSLVARSLVAPAAASSVRRAEGVSLVKSLAPAGPVLAFSDFVPTCEAFAFAAQSSGLRASALTGSQDPFERTLLCASFESGELDLLVVAASAQRGLNLQAARSIVHLDLPLTSVLVTQRTGRAVRIGSRHESVSAHVLSYADTSDELIRNLLRGVFSSVDLSEDSLISVFSDEPSVLDFTDAVLGVKSEPKH